MKINKTIILLAALTLGYASQAQQIPLYSNYFFTPFVYNPSMSGTEGSTEVTAIHRRQWTGIQGSPETTALTVNGSFNEEKVGWSVYGFADQTDIVQRMGIYGNYAYHVALSQNSSLSFGLGAGYLNNSIDINDIRSQQQGDIFAVTNGDRATFDLNAGVSLRVADFTFGAAVPQLFGQAIEYAETPDLTVNYSLLRHYVFNAQYDFQFAGDKRVLSPVVMVRAAKNVPIQADVGAIFRMEDYGYIGAMYRSEYAVTANVGVNLTQNLTVGYAYDFSINEYGPSLGTSHEIMLAFRFGDDRRNERLENEIKRLKEQQRRQRDETEEIVDEKLEEFKDQYSRELEQQIDEAVEDSDGTQGRQPQGGQQPGQQGGRQGQQQGQQQQGQQQNQQYNQGQQGQQGYNQGQQQQGNNQGQQGQQGQQGYNQGQQGGGYDPSTAASNVAPGSRGYYLVAGVFSNQGNATRLERRLEDQGFDAAVFQDPGNFYYYVYLRKFESYQQAEQAKNTNLNGNYSGDLWIKVVK